MQVVVRMPASYDSVQSIAFQLPGTHEQVQLPCRLIRNSEQDVEGDQVLGVEFLSEDDAQLLLIEKFIQDKQEGRNEARQLPRISCHLDDVTVERQDLQLLSIDNLSTKGLLLNYRGGLKRGEKIALSIGIPGDARRLNLSGSVVYVVENVFGGSLTAGIRLEAMKEIEERRLRNLIVLCSSGGALRDLYRQLDSRDMKQESRITEPALIDSIFLSLSGESVKLSTLVDGSLTILELEIERIDSSLRRFAIKSSDEPAIHGVQPGTAAYFAFYWNKGSHYFKTELIAMQNNLLVFPLPAVVFRSNKRSYQRKPLQASRVSLTVPGEGTEWRTFDGSLIDISRRGFLCELNVPDEYKALFPKGKSLQYEIDERLELGNEGQIRHVRARPTADGVVLQLGVEAGISRKAVRYERVSADKWETEKSRTDGPRGANARIDSLLVRFPDRSGREICAFINATRLNVRAPVVLIPSAYGKKKETFSPLVATLLASFWSEGKDIVTLRYDGINRPGESHQDDPNPRPGYEMLSYRISGGLGDLEAALDFVRANPYFVAEGVIVISFSMSAIDVRRMVSRGVHCGVDFWISCMGVPSAQTTLQYILGGIDIIGNYRLGIPSGIIGLLGHLVDMDKLAADMVDNKYAFLTDARLDMSRIAMPVLWIYGLYDKWVEADEVKDLMSVKAQGSREVLEVPTGHNLRTSDDAIQAFKLMTRWIFEKLYGKQIVARDPSKEELIRLLTAERERLENRAAPPLTEYWRGYLIGNERNTVGYDFYRNIPEFTGFLKAEARALELGEGEIIADMGCGTGLFLEQLLDHVAKEDGGVSVKEITAVDLVQDALDKTRAKCERISASNPRLAEISFRYLQKNLEPNRFIPVKRFVESEELTLDVLRNRIEGLPSSVLDHLIENATPELYAAMRGSDLTGSSFARLKSTTGPEDFQTVVEFNRAARFVQNRITESDLKPGIGSAPLSSGTLRSSDLLFQRLRFGDSDNILAFGFASNYFTRIIASLFISYVLNPEYVLSEFYQMLRPGGTLLVSTMKPDSDLSVIFTNYIQNIQNINSAITDESQRTNGADAARAMLNEAASLFELEEDGFFKFYTADELRNLLAKAGFVDISVFSSMGNPPQAYIATARKILTF